MFKLNLVSPLEKIRESTTDRPNENETKISQGEKTDNMEIRKETLKEYPEDLIKLIQERGKEMQTIKDVEEKVRSRANIYEQQYLSGENASQSLEDAVAKLKKARELRDSIDSVIGLLKPAPKELKQKYDLLINELEVREDVKNMSLESLSSGTPEYRQNTIDTILYDEGIVSYLKNRRQLLEENK